MMIQQKGDAMSESGGETDFLSENHRVGSKEIENPTAHVNRDRVFSHEHATEKSIAPAEAMGLQPRGFGREQSSRFRGASNREPRR